MATNRMGTITSKRDKFDFAVIAAWVTARKWTRLSWKICKPILLSHNEESCSKVTDCLKVLAPGTSTLR